jgi:hypothetical protein
MSATASGPAPPTAGWRARLAAPRIALPLLFAGGALLSAVTMLQGIQVNDEGLMLQAAARIADGQVPYHDFWWYYPPGQPYLLGGLWGALGPSLLAWRIVRVLADATVAVLAYLLARRAAPAPLALAAWLASALAMAYPGGPHPFPIALALCLGALLLFERRPGLAGLLAGVCAAWRIEFAAYLVLGVVAASLAAPLPRPERLRRIGRFAAAAAAAALVLFAPVVLSAGLADSWDLLIRYPVQDFSDYQSLPFPLDFAGPLNTSSPGGFLSDSLEPLLLFYLPLALVAGLAAALAALAVRWKRARDWPRLAAAVLGIGMAHYLLVRPDEFHTAPLAVLVAVLAAWALAGPRPARGWRRAAALGAAGVAAAALAYAVVEGADRRALALGEDTVALHLPAADGVRVRRADAAALEQAVRDVKRRAPAGQPIYVATRRSDLVTSGAPLFYVLAGRPNPTRYDIAAPGVVTSAPVQREIVADLERTRTPVVVRFTSPVTAAPEPNRAGRSSGVGILDAYLAGAYRPAARHGDWLILVRR